ncbi:hypothetical protein [Kribbella monticola]|uniref:hypothetical protein n=1 Tax=Kribbella monticola TaxID=2185285 RepID=UPI000DD37ADA|nr:hypothetical protein [Kribbella monticola]
MKTHDLDAVTRGLGPSPSTQITESAWTELSDGITATMQDAPAPVRRTPARPRLLLAAAGLLLIGGVVAATVANRLGQDLPQALSVADRGTSLTVRVVDQDADPKAYNQQFKKLGLDIKVRMVGVSPSNVGNYATFLYNTGSDGSELHLLKPGENCPATLNASDPGCQYGVEVSKSFKGHAEIEFGRAAKPGEIYRASPAEANAPGEELAGVSYRNQRVADVQKLLATHGLSVESYFNSKTELVNGVNTAKEVDPVPADWYVHSIQPHSPGKVMLWIGPEPEK